MKKFRLLASISSLCFAIAVLCFGVFAASSVTYTISGTISYTISDVFCDVTTAVYSYTEQLSSTDLNTLCGKFTEVATSGDKTVDSKTMKYVSSGTYTNSNGGVDGIITKSGDNLTIDKSKLALSYSNGTTKVLSYFIVTKINNLAGKALNVNCGTFTTISNNNAGSKTLTTIAANNSGIIVYGMSLADLKVGISSTEFSATITLSYSAS